MPTQEDIEFIARFRVEALAAAKSAEDALRGWADAAGDVGDEFKDTAKNVDAAAGQVIKAVAAMGTAAVVAFKSVSAGLQSFAELDRALIGIAKTSNLSDQEVRKLGASFRELAVQKGIDTSQYLEVAQIAGQLGVQGAENIRTFTSTVVDLGNASNLAGEEGAQVLARMLTVSGEGVEQANRLASVIVRMGNNVAASEKEIAMAAQEIMLATAPFDVGTTRATALGAAMAEMGLRAELSGTSVGRIFVEMTNASVAGGAALQRFADATGTTAEEFVALQKSDPTQLFMRLLKVMSTKDTQTIVKTLTDLKVMNSESAKSLLPLISNWERLSEVMAMAEKEAAAPTAMAEEAARAEQAFGRMYVRLKEVMKGLAQDLGAALAPVVTTAINGVLTLADAFNRLPDIVRQGTLVLVAFGPALTAAATAVTALRSALALLGVQVSLFGGIMNTVRAFVLTLTMNITTLGTASGIAATAMTVLGGAIRFMLGPIGLAITAVGALVAAYRYFSEEDLSDSLADVSSRFEESAGRIGTLNDQLKSDYADLRKAKEALAKAAEAEDAVGQQTAQREIARLNERINKSRELLEQEKLRRQAALEEAESLAAKARLEEQQAVEAKAISALRQVNPHIYTNWSAKRGIEKALLEQFPDGATIEQRMAVYNQIINNAFQQLRDAGTDIGDDWFKGVDEARKRLTEAENTVVSLKGSLDSLNGAKPGKGLAGDAGAATAEIKTLGRTLEEIYKAQETRSQKLRVLDADIATVWAENLRLRQEGKDVEAQAAADVAYALQDQREKLLDVKGRVAEVQESYAALREEVNNARVVGQSVLESVMDKLGQSIIAAAGDMENLNDADLSKLERSLQGISNLLTTMRSGFAGFLSGVAGFEPPTLSANQIEGYKQYGQSRIQGADARTANALQAVMDTIIKFEGWMGVGKWDENANRGGYGSSTVTLADGSIQKITAGMQINEADARRDLARRMGEYMAEQQKIIGAAWDGMTDRQIAAIASIQHNYGSIPDRIVEALRTGNNSVIAEAIASLAMDYTKSERAKGGARDQGTQPMNYRRRMEEASAFGDTNAYEMRDDRALDAVQEAYREGKKAADEAAEAIKKQKDAVKDLSAEKLKELQLDEFKRMVAGADIETREKAIALFQLELDLKEKGLTLDDKIIGSQLTYRQQWEQLYETAHRTVTLMPSIRDAISTQIAAIGDAASVGDQVIGDFVGGFDDAIDGILETGKLSSIRDAFGSAFQSMGATLIKFAMQILILKPFLTMLKNQLEDVSNVGGGGGGGFLSMIGKGLMSLFGGTSTGKSAKGNAFQQSKTVPMMMLGEAGPEALLPLVRGDGGELMVKAIGAPGAQSDDAVAGALLAIADATTRAAQAFSKAQDAQGRAEVAGKDASAATGQNTGVYGAPAMTYAPTFHIDARGGVDQTGGMNEKDAAAFGAALDMRIRATIGEFLIDQQRSGGMLNPAAKPYGA